MEAGVVATGIPTERTMDTRQVRTVVSHRYRGAALALAASAVILWPRAGQAYEGEGDSHYMLVGMGGGYRLWSGEGTGGNHFTGGPLLDLQLAFGLLMSRDGFAGVTCALDVPIAWTENAVGDSRAGARITNFLFTAAGYWGIHGHWLFLSGSLGASSMWFDGHSGDEVNFAGGMGFGALVSLLRWRYYGRFSPFLALEPRVMILSHRTQKLGTFGDYSASVLLTLGL